LEYQEEEWEEDEMLI